MKKRDLRYLPLRTLKFACPRKLDCNNEAQVVVSHDDSCPILTRFVPHFRIPGVHRLAPMAQICYHRVLTRLRACGSTKIEEQNATIGALTSSARRSPARVQKTRDKHTTQIKRDHRVWYIKELDR